ncbi:MAG: hypothetical protein P8Y42_03780 [Exilibacterium sp.]
MFLGLQGCTSVVIDEDQRIASDLQDGDAVVVLGRRHASDYETEPDLINCIGDTLQGGNAGINVISEDEFMDGLYPWFEPRTAPMKVRDLNRLLDRQELAQAMEQFHVRYIIWVDGNTETTNSAGSIGCSIGTGGAGCFGFGTWDKESDYEVSIWDYKNLQTLGKISADASGTSYMPAVVIPIPLIARVQANACKGIGVQLRSFLKPETTAANSK